MKKLLTYIVAGCLALGMAGCSTVQPVTPPVSQPSTTEPSAAQPSATLPTAALPTEDIPSVTEPANTVVPMYALVLPPAKETVTADDGTALFSLSFQQTQLILHKQELEEKIIGDLQNRMSPLLSDAEQFEHQAQLDYPDSEFWSEYFISISYTPTRLDQAVLSLFGNSSSYSGGPHPSLLTSSVNYDLETGEVLFLDDILATDCTSDALYQLLLQSLAEQADVLYYDYADALGDRFTGDLHGIQDWYFSRKGLCFHFSPYDIAPYSSGTIIAELPYSNLTGVLKDKYLPTETSVATGSIYAEAYIEDDSERFSYIAQVPLNENGNEVLIYPDATVTDLRIETGSRYSDSNQYIPGATVFVASTMNVGDAIRLTADLNDEDTVFRLIYRSGNQEYSAFIAYDEAGDSILLTNG